jgi:hypothetical protein
MTKLRQVCTAAALAATASGAALAETTATVGIMSDYIWRGQYVSDGSAYGSIDVNTDSGIYMGVWGADIINGLEYDLYFGYAGGGEEFTWNVGFTGYYATDEAFDTLEEINLGFSYGFLSVDYSLGDQECGSFCVAPNSGSRQQTYEYVITTFTPAQGPYFVVGRGDYHNVDRIHASGASGYWFELGKDFEVMDDLEIGIAAIYSPDTQATLSDPTPRSINLSPTNPTAEYALVMHISKNFGIGGN